MKHLTLRLREAIRRGILRIFPLPPLSLKMPPVTVTLALALASCASHRQAIRPLRNVSADTVRLSSQLYDSVYICRDRLLDRSRDTVYLRDVSIEYRYRLHRDTIHEVHHDTIPYQVTVTEVKEITRPLTFFDHLTRFTFWFAVGALLTFLFIKIKLTPNNPRNQQKNIP